MKLRLRSLETKEALRLEIPDSRTLDDLKTLIAGMISSPSPISPQSIRLSLNRTDEIVPSAPADSLQTLGLASGDLLFFSLSDSSSPPKIPDSAMEVEKEKEKEKEAPFEEKPPQTVTLIPPPSFGVQTPDSAMEVEREARLLENPCSFPGTLSPTPTPTSAPAPETFNFGLATPGLGPEISSFGAEVPVVVRNLDHGDEFMVEVEKAPSLPCLLTRVMEAEKGTMKGTFGTFVVAVHAVFLESGFVVSHGNPSRLPGNWASATSTVSVKYTIPELLDSIGERDVKVSVVKFVSMGSYVVVYGSLSGESSDAYRLSLDAKKMETALDLTDVDAMTGDQEKEIFKFWNMVKDKLSLPLMIDTCEKNGLPPPPCFARLPTDVKGMILELLPGVDIARMSCTSSEMRYLASNDELWKKKAVEEFGEWNEMEGKSWKEKFVRSWMRSKAANNWFKRGDIYRMRMQSRLPARAPRYPIIGDHELPQRFPIIGGGYYRFPAGGGIGPRIPGVGLTHNPTRRNFSPRCNLVGNRLSFSR